MTTTAPMAQDSLPVGSVSGPSSPAAAASQGVRARRKAVLAVAAVVVAVVVTAYVLYSSRFESTDDAQIDGTISNVSPRVSGTVSAVYVADNQSVKEGQLLAELDPTDLNIALDQAKAEVAQAQAQLAAEDPNVPILLASNVSAVSLAQSDLAAAQAALSAARMDVDRLTAQLAQAQATDRTTQLDKQRSEKLVAQGAVSQSDFDTRENAAVASAANLDALGHSLAGAKDHVRQQQAQLVALESRVVEVKTNAPRQVATGKASLVIRQAALELAQARLAQAERNLSYAKITSPVTGIVAKKALALGDYVSPGQSVVGIAQTDSLWVTANYRETQITRLHPGQAVTVHVDALGEDLRGSVGRLGGATGARLSVLPPENASGNYVKVVQRIPIRIELDPGQAGLDRLRIGMSVEPEVRVR